ncbi:PIN domain-like protein [Mycena rebaudengoi]|nr:PIN domain-like protein [Mycena rebaudengoi]
MGTHGLHPEVRHLRRTVKVSDGRGRRIGIDGGWLLHRACHHQNVLKAAAAGRATLDLKCGMGFVVFAEKLIHGLLALGIDPFVVFDGRTPASKSGEKQERDANRTESWQQCVDALREEKACLAKMENEPVDLSQPWKDKASAFHQEAVKAARGAVAVTPEMTQQVMKLLAAEDVPYIVAPYEADGQLAHMCRVGYLYAVITEDSDLMPLACPRIWFKFSMGSPWTVQEILYEDLFTIAPSTGDSKLDFTKFSRCRSLFLGFCVAVGCDYLKRIPGIGPAKVYRHACEAKDLMAFVDSLANLPNATDDYRRRFMRAYAAFTMQPVYVEGNEENLYSSPLSGNGRVVYKSKVLYAVAKTMTDAELEYVGRLIPSGPELKGLVMGVNHPSLGTPLSDPFNHYTPSRKLTVNELLAREEKVVKEARDHHRKKQGGGGGKIGGIMLHETIPL